MLAPEFREVYMCKLTTATTCYSAPQRVTPSNWNAYLATEKNVLGLQLNGANSTNESGEYGEVKDSNEVEKLSDNNSVPEQNNQEEEQLFNGDKVTFEEHPLPIPAKISRREFKNSICVGYNHCNGWEAIILLDTSRARDSDEQGERNDDDDRTTTTNTRQPRRSNSTASASSGSSGEGTASTSATSVSSAQGIATASSTEHRSSSMGITASNKLAHLEEEQGDDEDEDTHIRPTARLILQHRQKRQQYIKSLNFRPLSPCITILLENDNNRDLVESNDIEITSEAKDIVCIWMGSADDSKLRLYRTDRSFTLKEVALEDESLSFTSPVMAIDYLKSSIIKTRPSSAVSAAKDTHTKTDVLAADEVNAVTEEEQGGHQTVEMEALSGTMKCNGDTEVVSSQENQRIGSSHEVLGDSKLIGEDIRNEVEEDSVPKVKENDKQAQQEFDGFDNGPGIEDQLEGKRSVDKETVEKDDPLKALQSDADEFHEKDDQLGQSDNGKEPEGDDQVKELHSVNGKLSECDDDKVEVSQPATPQESQSHNISEASQSSDPVNNSVIVEEPTVDGPEGISNTEHPLSEHTPNVAPPLPDDHEKRQGGSESPEDDTKVQTQRTEEKKAVKDAKLDNPQDRNVEQAHRLKQQLSDSKEGALPYVDKHKMPQAERQEAELLLLPEDYHHLALACQDGTIRFLQFRWSASLEIEFLGDFTVIVDGPIVGLHMNYNETLGKIEAVVGSLCGYVARFSKKISDGEDWEGPFMVAEGFWNSLKTQEDSVLTVHSWDDKVAVGTYSGRCLLYGKVSDNPSDDYGRPFLDCQLPDPINGICHIPSAASILLLVTTRRSIHVFQEIPKSYYTDMAQRKLQFLLSRSRHRLPENTILPENTAGPRSNPKSSIPVHMQDGENNKESPSVVIRSEGAETKTDISPTPVEKHVAED